MEVLERIPLLRRGHLDRLPLFPLPNVVFFPRVRLPLYVFEPRYQRLITDVIEREVPLAIPLLRPGFEEDYAGSPPMYDVAGLGWIVEHDPLPDGRAMVMVQGVERVRLLDEIPGREPYRLARAEVLQTEWPEDPAVLARALAELRQVAMTLALRHARLAVPMEPLFREDLPEDLLADLVSAALIRDTTLRQQLLAEVHLVRRLTLAAEGLATIVARGDDPAAQDHPASA